MTSSLELKSEEDTVRTYLRSIGRIPLLTHEQELTCGQQVQQMTALLAAKETLVREVGHEPTLREWADRVDMLETELAEVVRRGQRAKQKMIEANLRLVVAIAKRYQKRGLDLLDLIQEGAIGLTRAVDKFEPGRGYKFSTYAYHWIRQGITRAIAEKSRTIRLPIHITEKLNKIKKAQCQLSQKLERTPTLAEVATELGITLEQAKGCLRWMQQPLSLEMRVGSKRDTELGELLEDPNSEELLVQSFLAEDLNQMLADLTVQQQTVLTLRFGLADGKSWTLDKVGTHLNLSRERVRQIEKMALSELRHQERIAQML
ncbi:MAG: RNA polymerase sigma factor, RpoD/SigA family [Chroococcidiopsidaceae cyanobacterium CP_BM_RX_35]|nr:RNA polymerase sigma factor, RpoD/SigA family [Chroococcidiopsidaceae cyanobacterium CP_BM_RX_35]